MSTTGEEGQTDNLSVTDAVNLAISHCRQGRTEDALRLCREIIKDVPDSIELLQLAGNLASTKGEHRLAKDFFCRIIEIDPGNTAVHNWLGATLGALGKWEEAAASYKRAIALEPGFPETHNNLGTALAELNRFDLARASYLRALELSPGFAKAHNNLGILLSTRGHFQAALESCKHAIDIDPGYAKAHGAYGNALHALGFVDEAVHAFRRAIAIDPNLDEAHNSLGNAMKLKGRYGESLDAYRRAIAINPTYAAAYYNLGNAQSDLSQFEDSQISLRKCRQLEASPGVTVRLALLSPIIAKSLDQIRSVRENVAAALDELTDRGLRIADPYSETRFTNFLFAYHGVDDHALQEKIANFYLRACPELSWAAPHCAEPGRNADGRRIRLGLASAFFHGHTVGKLFHGVIKHLSPDRFEKILFHASGKRDEISEACENSVDKVVALGTSNLAQARRQIAAEELDILFYPDIGMDSLTFFAAFARLAKVQCCSWGHGITTGIPNMDYFISCGAMEAPDGQKYYSEKLVRLEHFPMFYYRPDKPRHDYSRSALGLPGEGALYVCPQSLFKFHPNFDETLGALLRRDRQGWLVLIADNFEGHWQSRLMDRFRRAFPDRAERVVFIDRLPGGDFLGLLRIADALLDVPQYSGGNTTLEALSFGAPVVTWPGPLLKERVTAAFYRYIGITDLVADGSQAYVEIAFRLAHDRPWRKEITSRILERSGRLYENMEAVKKMEHFFIAAHEARSR